MSGHGGHWSPIGIAEGYKTNRGKEKKDREIRGGDKEGRKEGNKKVRQTTGMQKNEARRMS